MQRAAALEASAAGVELAKCGCIAECPSPTERQRSGSTGAVTHQIVGDAVVQRVARIQW